MNLKTNPEFLPLVEWWEKDGKKIVLVLVVFLAAFGGWKYYQMRKVAEKAAASNAFAMGSSGVQAADSVLQLEDAVAKYGDMATGGALKIRLAKAYYDCDRYEEALAQYEALDGKAPDGCADIPVIGKAQCLEALGKYEEACKVFEGFAKENPKNPFTLTARLGVARCVCQNGDKAKALALLDALKEENKDDGSAKRRIEATASIVRLYEKKTNAPAEPAVSK